MKSDDVQEILDRANELLEAGQPEETLRCLQSIESDLYEAEDRIDCGSLKAWALSELGQGNDALEVLETLIHDFPDSARLHGTLGVVLSNDGDLDEACNALEHAVQLDADDEVSLANLGLVYEKLRLYDQALELYNKAINMGAEIDWLMRRLASVQAELGLLEEARGTLKRYLSLAPDDADQWIALAILQSEDQRFDEAFGSYRAAEQVAPDSPSLRLNWGVTAVRAGELEVAGQQLLYLTRLEPESTRPLLLEAFIAEERGDIEGATEKYVDALSHVRREDFAELSYSLEMAMDFFGRQGLVDPCEQLFEQAYIANACTVELCEAYREARGRVVEHGIWYSILVEADYRPGLVEVRELDTGDSRKPDRFLRNYQVIAENHDEALGLVMDLAERMGETSAVVREFINEEAAGSSHAGIYEIERESIVFAGEESF